MYLINQSSHFIIRNHRSCIHGGPKADTHSVSRVSAFLDHPVCCYCCYAIVIYYYAEPELMLAMTNGSLDPIWSRFEFNASIASRAVQCGLLVAKY